MFKEQVHLIPPVPPARYFYKPLGIDYDSHVRKVIELLSNLPDSQRIENLHILRSQERAVLSAFSIRAASLAVLSKSSSILQDGIVSVVFRISDADYFSDYIALAVLRDAASRIGIDFNSLLTSAANLGTLEASKLVLAFTSNMATLEEMSYQYIDDKENSRYLPILP